jgi:hypothetical protein
MTGDKEISLTPSLPRVGRLDSLRAVRLEMVRVYREGRAGHLDTKDMARFVFVLQAIGKVLEASDLESRLATIEKALEEPDGSQPSNTPYAH